MDSNLPIGAAVFFLVLLCLKPKPSEDPIKKLPTKEKLKHLDPLGIILLLGSVCCLILALQWGGNNYPWRSSRVVGLLVGFGLLLLAFCGLQWQLDDKATIPPRILKERTVLFGACALFFISFSSNIVCRVPGMLLFTMYELRQALEIVLCPLLLPS